MKMCPMLLHNPGLKDIADSCAHRADPRVATLEAELAKHQESQFNPDWSQLEATRAALREQQAQLKKAERLIDAALRLQPHLLCDREGSPETDFCMALTPFELERIRKQEVKS